MQNYICITCGVQYESSHQPPGKCIICEDERQYVNREGQQWTTLDKIRENYKNKFTEMEPGVFSIKTYPGYAIGQRAFLIRTDEGNILWDCVTLLDDETIKRVNDLGGIKAIAISHPHYYSTIIEWSKAFDNAPIYIHKDDSQWVTRKEGNIKSWEGENLSLFGNLTLVRCGGHFEGGAVMHWNNKSKGILFSGDIIQVVPDTEFVSFMYSYPNLIPLSELKVNNIVKAVEPYEFEKIYGAFLHREVLENGKEVVLKSAERYINAIK